MSESDLKAKIRDALRAAGHAIWVNAQGGRTYRTGLGKGTADIIGLVPCNGVGRFTAWEIKTKTGKPSKEQIEWCALVNATGGYAVFVTSVEEALSAAMAAGRGERAE